MKEAAQAAAMAALAKGAGGEGAKGGAPSASSVGDQSACAGMAPGGAWSQWNAQQWAQDEWWERQDYKRF